MLHWSLKGAWNGSENIKRISTGSTLNLGSSSTLSGFSAPQGTQENPHAKIEMIFRVWGANAKATEAAGGESVDAHHPGVVALIEDAVASKRGVFPSSKDQTSKDQIYVSGLKRPADALVVSRQVQLGLQGFRGKHAPGPVAVSIVIDASGNSEAANAGDQELARSIAAPEPPHELVTLLKLAKPAQILLTHDLCQQVAQMKGLPLKSFPGRFGVYEYLWTGEEKLDLLQSEPQLTLAAMPAAPGTAPAKDKNVVARAVNPPAAAAVRELDHADEPGHTVMVPEKRPALQSPRVLILGAVGLVVLVAAILIGVHLLHAPGSASAPANPTTPTPEQTSSPAPAVAPATGPGTGSAAGSRQKPHAAAVVSKPATHQPAKPAAQGEDKPVAVTAPAPAPVPSASCTLGANPGRFVDLAEQARGRGDYANAIRIFREVLNCDPNNAAARVGLDKATSGAQQSQH
jgi:hypothetical protein